MSLRYVMSNAARCFVMGDRGTGYWLPVTFITHHERSGITAPKAHIT